jgi:hypothetical protein
VDKSGHRWTKVDIGGQRWIKVDKSGKKWTKSTLLCIVKWTFTETYEHCRAHTDIYERLRTLTNVHGKLRTFLYKTKDSNLLGVLHVNTRAGVICERHSTTILRHQLFIWYDTHLPDVPVTSTGSTGYRYLFRYCLPVVARSAA